MSKSKSKNRKKATINKKLLLLSIGFGALIISGLIAYKTFFQDQATKFSLNAVIVDQLSVHFPNATFITRATNLLTNAGFNVSYFSSESVNVSFYQRLVEGTYGIIILRAHSALRVNETIVDLFTSEPYDRSKYYEYQVEGLLSKAEYLVPMEQTTGQSYYFAITPNFIEKFGHFPKSIIIAMGCSGLNVSGMAQAFISRDATAYVGWTNVVLAKDTDYETARFLEMLLGENRTLATSIAITNHYPYHDSSTNTSVTSNMEFYPFAGSVGDLRISDLIAETKNPKALFSSVEQFSFLIAKVIADQEKDKIEGNNRFIFILNKKI
jgi:hypothetical protein